MSAPRRLPLKLVAVAIGVAGALVAVELGLRLSAAVILERSGRLPEADDWQGGLTILCCGDSNVFGIYEERSDSYPARLGALLEARVPDGPHRVVNGGRPGWGSREVARELAGQIARYRPDAVLVTVGANNVWGWSGEPEAGDGAPFWEDLRLAKVFRLFVDRRRQQAEETEDGGPGWGRAEDKLTSLRDDLGRMLAVANEAGVPLAVCAYGADGVDYGQPAFRRRYARANDVLRDFAREQGLALADASSDLRELARSAGHDRVFYLDLHPRPPGYELVARHAYNSLVELGIAAGEPIATPLDDLDMSRVARTRIAVVGEPGAPDGSPDELALVVDDGPAGLEVRMLIWGGEQGDVRAPLDSLQELDDDPLFRATFRLGRPPARFDGEGRLRLPLRELFPPEKLRALRGLRFRAAYVAYEDAAAGRIAYVSDAVVLELP